MKKFAIGFLLLVSIFFIGNVKGYAEEQNIYLKTKEIPLEISQYVTANWQNGLNAQTLLTGEDSAQFYLGKGFSIESDSNNYFYPLIKNSETIAYLLEISKGDNNELNFNVNNYWVDTLNSLDQKTAADSPMRLIEKNGRLFTEQNNSTQLIMDRFTPESEVLPLYPPVVGADADELVVNIIEPTEQYKPQIRLRSGTQEQAKFNMDMANRFEIWEYQQDLPWCEAYSVAGILNYKAGKQITTAEKILKWINPKKPINELKKIGTSTPDVIRYCNSLGYKPINVQKPFSFNEIKTHVNSKDPMVAVLKNQNTPNSHHTVDILGWLEPPKSSGQPNMMYIWNPWYQMTSPMSCTDSHQFVLSTTKYTWITTTHNFKK